MSMPESYLWVSNVSANERRRYMCNFFSQWLRSFWAIDRKWIFEVKYTLLQKPLKKKVNKYWLKRQNKAQYDHLNNLYELLYLIPHQKRIQFQLKLNRNCFSIYGPAKVSANGGGCYLCYVYFIGWNLICSVIDRKRVLKMGYRMVTSVPWRGNCANIV